MNIDLQSFCARPSDSRSILHHPMRVGAWVYATNGHYCVRVPAGDEPEANQEKVPKNMAVFFAGFAGAEFVPMPELPQAIPCLHCAGSGTLRGTRCPDCEDGQFSHGGYLYECKHCAGEPTAGFVTDPDGSESAECDECFGRGFVKWQRTRIGECDYELGYLNEMAALPSPVLICTTGGPCDAMKIRFDGGEALLMPMRPRREGG